MINNIRLSSYIGLSGVAENETESALRWGGRLEWPMLGVAILILVEWYLEAKGLSTPLMSHVTNWIVWLAFVVETVLLTSLVRDKLFYLRTNWMNLIIIALGVPILWEGMEVAAALRSLRLLIAAEVLINISGSLRTLLRRNNLGTTLFVALIVILIAGLVAAGLDPAIDTPWEGIWWAWVTVTTVGYGDVVPVSLEGRLLGAFLILLGIGLFAMLTASFSAMFISQTEEEVEEEIEEEIHYTKAETMEKLDNIEKRLNKLEKHILKALENIQQNQQ
jgi:voltage-gated potassium channel